MPNVTFNKIGADSFGSNVQPVGNVLRFFDVNFENRGIYQCIAEANGVTVKANTIVNVEGECLRFKTLLLLTINNKL